MWNGNLTGMSGERVQGRGGMGSLHHHALHVLDAELDVLVEGLLGQIDHVGGEEGLAIGLEVLLVGLEHAVEPGEELLGAVVRVEHNGHSVGLGNVADIVSALQRAVN